MFERSPFVVLLILCYQFLIEQEIDHRQRVLMPIKLNGKTLFENREREMEIIHRVFLVHVHWLIIDHNV